MRGSELFRNALVRITSTVERKRADKREMPMRYRRLFLNTEDGGEVLEDLIEENHRASLDVCPSAEDALYWRGRQDAIRSILSKIETSFRLEEQDAGKE